MIRIRYLCYVLNRKVRGFNNKELWEGSNVLLFLSPHPQPNTSLNIAKKNGWPILSSDVVLGRAIKNEGLEDYYDLHFIATLEHPENDELIVVVKEYSPEED